MFYNFFVQILFFTQPKMIAIEMYYLYADFLM